MPPLEVSRRDALCLLAAFVASSATSERSWSSTTVRAELIDGLDLSVLQEIGQEYLAAYPADRSVSSVAMLLDVNADGPSALRKLQRMMHADYEAARLVNLAGWFISVTEARIFAGFSGSASTMPDVPARRR